MAKTINGVPEYIGRDDYTGLVAAVGFDPTSLTELRFVEDGIYATVVERDENGSFRVDGESLVKSTVFIPVKDGDK